MTNKLFRIEDCRKSIGPDAGYWIVMREGDNESMIIHSGLSHEMALRFLKRMNGALALWINEVADEVSLEAGILAFCVSEDLKEDD